MHHHGWFIPGTPVDKASIDVLVCIAWEGLWEADYTYKGGSYDGRRMLVMATQGVALS
jgi:hypothetical protein